MKSVETLFKSFVSVLKVWKDRLLGWDSYINVKLWGCNCILTSAFCHWFYAKPTALPKAVFSCPKYLGCILGCCRWRLIHEPFHMKRNFSHLHKHILKTTMRSYPVSLAYIYFYISIVHLPCFVHASSEGSGEPVRMHRLAWAFAARICHTYQYFISWLK